MFKDTQLNLYEAFDNAEKIDSRTPEEIAEGIRTKIAQVEIAREEKRKQTLSDKYANLRGKSFKEIAENSKREELETAKKLAQTRAEINNESEYPEKPKTEDDDFIEPYSPAEEYYGRWK